MIASEGGMYAVWSERSRLGSIASIPPTSTAVAAARRSSTAPWPALETAARDSGNQSPRVHGRRRSQRPRQPPSPHHRAVSRLAAAPGDRLPRHLLHPPAERGGAD